MAMLNNQMGMLNYQRVICSNSTYGSRGHSMIALLPAEARSTATPEPSSHHCNFHGVSTGELWVDQKLEVATFFCPFAQGNDSNLAYFQPLDFSPKNIGE